MRLLLAPTVSLAIALQGCGTVGYDHREKISNALLFNSNGAVDERAFSGALTERLSLEPLPQASLRSFVESLSGTCTDSLLDRMSCALPLSAGYCMQSIIRIEASMVAGSFKITNVATDRRGC